MKILKKFQGLNKFKQMKLYVIVLVLMVFVSACAQQPAPVEPEVAPVETQPEVQPETVAPVEVPEEVVEVASYDIRYGGAGGFDPDSLTISAGSSVTWINGDEKPGGIVIFKEGKAFINSQRLLSDEKFEQEFAEPGNYEFWWNLAFSPIGGKITVE